MRVNVIGSCDLDTSLACSLATWLKTSKSVFDAHEYFTEVPELSGRRIVKAIWRSIGKFTIGKYDLRYTVNASLAGILGKAYRAHFEVIRNVPLNDKQSFVVVEERENVLLYQGALNAGRGLEQAILAMKLIDGYTLHLAGEGDLSDDLRELVEMKKLRNKVVFLGRLTPAELKKVTSRALIGLNLLHEESLNYYYSLANKFFDYAHAGVPSINMNFPEYNGILNEHRVGVTISDLEPTTIAVTIQSLLDDRKKLESMIHACIQFKKEFDWSIEKLHLLSMIRPLIRHRNL